MYNNSFFRKGNTCKILSMITLRNLGIGENDPVGKLLCPSIPRTVRGHLTRACERQITAGEGRSLSTWPCVETWLHTSRKGQVSCPEYRKMPCSSLHRHSGLPSTAPRQMTSGCPQWLVFFVTRL